jgi:hypothetical protein
MEERIYSANGIEIWRRADRFFICYDAGSHMAQLREDEITAEEAIEATLGEANATDVLFRLQRRILAGGGDPYRSNIF